MPTATTHRAITKQDGRGAPAAARQWQQGDPAITRFPGQTIHQPRARVRQSAPGRDGNATIFRVHGRGVLVGLIANEFGIARTVTAAIKEAFGSVSTTCQFAKTEGGRDTQNWKSGVRCTASRPPSIAANIHR